MANGTRWPEGQTTSQADERLLEAITQAMAWHFWIPKERISVEVSDGWISLRGNVEWLFQKQGAEDAVCKVEGVRGITNNIEVDLREPTRYYPHPASPWGGKHYKTGR